MPAAAAVRRRVRVEMRPEGGKIFRGAGLSGDEWADAVGFVITAESCPCKVLVGRGACWATIVAAAGASAEPWSPPGGTTKTEAKAALAAGDKTLRPGRRSTVATEADTRATNLPEGAEGSSILIRGLCVRKSRKSEGVKGSPPKTALSLRGTSRPRPTPGVCEERVRNSQARMRKKPPSSTGGRLLDPLRS